MHLGRGARLLLWTMTVVSALIGLGLGALLPRLGEPLWPALVALGLAGFFLLTLGLIEWSLRRGWKSHTLLREGTRGTLASDGISMEGELGSARVPGDRFYQWAASPSVLLIYQSTALFHLLPREFFATDEDWSAAGELVAARLPSRRQRRRWRRWLSALLWIAVVIVFVILLLSTAPAAPVR